MPLTVSIENLTEKPFCVLNSDLPNKGYLPENIDFKGDVDLVLPTAGGYSQLPSMEIVIVFPQKRANFFSDLHDKLIGEPGEFEVYYEIDIYQCDELTSINSYFEYLNVKRKTVTAYFTFK